MQINLPDTLQERVEAVARALGRPPSWVVEQALAVFLDAEEIREAIAEADAGDFASTAEVEAVFAKWISGHDAS